MSVHCISHSSPGTTSHTLAVLHREISGSSEMLGRRRDGSQHGPGEGGDESLSPPFSTMLRSHLTATLPAQCLLSLALCAVQWSPSASYSERFGCENQSAKWLIGDNFSFWALEPNRYGLESRLGCVTCGIFVCLFPHLQNGDASSSFLKVCCDVWTAPST